MNDNCPLHPTVPCDCVPRYYRSAPAQREPIQPEAERLAAQIKELAQFIIENVPGEPSQSEGAIDTAIRVIAALQQQLRDATTTLGLANQATSHQCQERDAAQKRIQELEQRNG